jgi:hypothetical protein
MIPGRHSPVLVPRRRLERPTWRLGGTRSIQLSYRGVSCIADIGGAEEDRTPDLFIANEALSQLSYGPNAFAGSHAAGTHCPAFYTTLIIQAIGGGCAKRGWRAVQVISFLTVPFRD